MRTPKTIVREFATFRSDIEDDAVEDDDGNFIEWPPRNAARMIAASGAGLRGVGPIPADMNGWELEATLGDKPIWRQGR